MREQAQQYDVIIAGGGPAGSTAAIVLARAGAKVVVLEKGRFPRFHIGESLLPRNFPLLVELGLEKKLEAVPHTNKLGAEFGMGNCARTQRFTFDMGLVPGSATINVERAAFDRMLLTAAKEEGAEVREGVVVREIERLEDGEVRVRVGDSSEPKEDGGWKMEDGNALSSILNPRSSVLNGRWPLDCTGQSTLVGRHLGTRRVFDDPRLRKVAYFEHFEGVERLSGKEAGHPGIFMAKEGWFWMIPLDEKRTSVGFVTRPDFAKEVGVAAGRMLGWAVQRCPVVRQRMRRALGPEVNQTLGDFSYTCRPYAGPGYFLVGDAGSFLDPIFSTGVTLAMMGGAEAGRQLARVLKKQVSVGTARKEYIRFVEGSTLLFWRLIRGYYDHSFRELFLNGKGPMRVHSAVISILAGQVFPKPAWALRWRLRLFELLVWLNKWVPMVPRWEEFSLVEEKAEAWPTVGAAFRRPGRGDPAPTVD